MGVCVWGVWVCGYVGCGCGCVGVWVCGYVGGMDSGV